MRAAMSNNHGNNERSGNSFEEFRNAVRELEKRTHDQLVEAYGYGDNVSRAIKINGDFRHSVLAAAAKFADEGYISAEELAEIRKESASAERCLRDAENFEGWHLMSMPEGVYFDGDMDDVPDDDGVLDDLYEMIEVEDIDGVSLLAVELGELSEAEEEFCIRAYECYGDCEPAYKDAVKAHDAASKAVFAVFDEADRRVKEAWKQTTTVESGKLRILWASVWDKWYAAAERWWHRLHVVDFGPMDWRDSYYCEGRGLDDSFGLGYAYAKAAITLTGEVLKEARERRRGNSGDGNTR